MGCAGPTLGRIQCSMINKSSLLPARDSRHEQRLSHRRLLSQRGKSSLSPLIPPIELGAHEEDQGSRRLLIFSTITQRRYVVFCSFSGKSILSVRLVFGRLKPHKHPAERVRIDHSNVFKACNAAQRFLYGSHCVIELCVVFPRAMF
jgi:hypothetical protein